MVNQYRNLAFYASCNCQKKERIECIQQINGANPSEKEEIFRANQLREGGFMTIADYKSLGGWLARTKNLKTRTITSMVKALQHQRLAHYHVFCESNPFVAPEKSMFLYCLHLRRLDVLLFRDEGHCAVADELCTCKGSPGDQLGAKVSEGAEDGARKSSGMGKDKRCHPLQ